MSKFPRPTKQFDFIGRNFAKLTATQRALVRRTDYRGTPFNDGVGSQSKEMSSAISDGLDAESQQLSETMEVHEVEIAWEDAQGYEFDGPTYLTLTMEGQDLLKFRITDDFHFMFYSNTRNYIDVTGKLEKE